MLYIAYILDTIRGLSYYADFEPFGIDDCIRTKAQLNILATKCTGIISKRLKRGSEL